jgi:16S rRNA processing protein RimM
LENLVIIGKIISAYGVKGWVKDKTISPKQLKILYSTEQQFLSRNQKDWNSA